MPPPGAQAAAGDLELVPALDRPDLYPGTVRDALPADALVCEIDPARADTATLAATHGVPDEASANCVVVGGKRDGEERIAACVVLASTRADVNNAVKRALDVRKASFLPQDRAVGEAGMEYGGITPVGVPAGWRILVDTRVAATEWLLIGSGVRRSKLVVRGRDLAALPGAEVVDIALTG
ncbi:YbaK/EbsC family protein [Kineococcus gynurae]|uniref:YbaK/EbsC family protein n=1 Tax=Kineococcus gynurae TaxID=452979 RepID=A0ABV5LXH1_9ACTN